MRDTRYRRLLATSLAAGDAELVTHHANADTAARFGTFDVIDGTAGGGTASVIDDEDFRSGSR